MAWISWIANLFHASLRIKEMHINNIIYSTLKRSWSAINRNENHKQRYVQLRKSFEESVENGCYCCCCGCDVCLSCRSYWSGCCKHCRNLQNVKRYRRDVTEYIWIGTVVYIRVLPSSLLNGRKKWTFGLTFKTGIRI